MVMESTKLLMRDRPVGPLEPNNYSRGMIADGISRHVFPMWGDRLEEHAQVASRLATHLFMLLHDEHPQYNIGRMKDAGNGWGPQPSCRSPGGPGGAALFIASCCPLWASDYGWMDFAVGDMVKVAVETDEELRTERLKGPHFATHDELLAWLTDAPGKGAHRRNPTPELAWSDTKIIFRAALRFMRLPKRIMELPAAKATPMKKKKERAR